MKNVKVIDLFCGIGGLTHGLTREGLDVITGFDIDESCRYAYQANNNAKFINRDVSDLTKEDLEALYGECDIKVLVGCAPCQPFSTYNSKDPDKEKWNLLTKFGELIKSVKPDIVSMENVPNIINFKKYPVYDSFLEVLKEEGYHVDAQILYGPDYGIPQTRKRLILVASKLGKISLPPKSHTPDTYLKVQDVISDLDPINDGEVSINDPLHTARALTPINKKRIRITSEGGGWHEWPEELKLACHKRENGKTYGSVYGRMRWDEPAPTMTTQCIGLGNGRFGHPEQDRAITLREAAIFQTFPKEYKFIDPEKPLSKSALARQIGNAVPVRLGEVVGESIKKHLASM